MEPAADGAVLFEYFGRTTLVIVGPVTGVTYRFNHPGARTAVHARDRTSLNAVPVLREVTSA